MAYTRQLDDEELRVLGSLMEKEQATPEYYPMTFKAVLAACNQKSNRDPVTQLTEDELRAALERLRRDVLVWRSSGARSERWEHRLSGRWHLDAKSKAVMTLLMLRGAQTPGELRSRAERLHAFASVAEVEETLRRLSEGEDALVREEPRRPGQRERRWRHLVGSESGEVPRLPPQPGPAAAVAEVAPEGVEERLSALEARVAELAAEIDELRRRSSGQR